MLPLLFFMLLVLAVAGLVLAYVAFPHRGQAIPRAPWLTEVMERWADRAPTLEKTAEAPRDEGSQHRR